MKSKIKIMQAQLALAQAEKQADKSKSPAQHRFMEVVAHNPEFAEKVEVPQSVGKEFVAADDQESVDWIGVDLDGTLALYTGSSEIGAPNQVMLNAVRDWLEQGRAVKIFTARVGEDDDIQEWLEENGLPALEVTNIKDHAMVELWDDKARNPAELGDGKARINVFGLPIVIEDASDSAVYGCIENTIGADDKPVDVFINPLVEAEKAHVIAQNTLEGGFCENIVMLGYPDKELAAAAYKANYPNGAELFGGIEKMKIKKLKRWLSEGGAVLPVSDWDD